MRKRYWIGARFACRRCLTRSGEPICPVCKEKSADLSIPDDEFLRDALAGDRLKAPSGGGLRGYFRRQGTPSRVAWVGSVVAALAAIVSIFSQGGAEAHTYVLLPVVFAFFTALFRLTAYLAELVGRLALVVLALIATLLGAIVLLFTREEGPSRARLSRVVSWLLDGSMKLLTLGEALPTLRLPRSPWSLPMASVEGVTTQDMDLFIVVGAKGSVVYDDAVIAPFQAKDAEGSPFRVEPDVGLVAFDPDRSALSPGAALTSLPPWLAEAPSDARQHFLFPEGSPVAFSGGEWSEEVSASGSGGHFRSAPRERVLRGTRARPLHVTLGAPER